MKDSKGNNKLPFSVQETLVPTAITTRLELVAMDAVGQNNLPESTVSAFTACDGCS
jgi:hypothetical protein